MSIAADTITTESSVEIQRQTKNSFGAPDDSVIRNLVMAVLSETEKANAGVTVRVVDKEEIRTSNKQWRAIDKATNVLSFAAEFPAETGIEYLGDILICAEVLQRESVEQNKALKDHWSHIVVHGTLHLLGYDHENEEDAVTMEAREKEILAGLGVADPYMPVAAG